MKWILAILFITCTAPSTAIAKDSTSRPIDSSNWQVMFDAGFDPAGMWGSWGPRYALRVGISKQQTNHFTPLIDLFLEYCQYGVTDEFATGFQHIVEGSAVRRHDVSLYGAIRYYGISLAMGATWVKSDPVTFQSGYGPGSIASPWQYGGLAKISPYLSLGYRFDIRLASSVLLPVGVYYVLPTMRAQRFFTVRFGVAAEF